MSMTLEQAKEKLAKYGQEHVLKYYGELTEEEKRGILDQIEATDMSILEACKHKEDLAKKGVTERILRRPVSKRSVRAR